VTSIDDDEIDLNTSSIPTDASVVKAHPQAPSNPYSNTWKWSDVTSATLTLVDIAKQGDLSSNLFYAGIFLGIAGGRILALVPELSRVIESILEDRKSSRRRKNPFGDFRVPAPGRGKSVHIAIPLITQKSLG
jgi:hypothetical protein